MAKRDGGPAFPETSYFDDKPIGSAGGMSLRDYFAAKALADVLQHFNWNDDAIETAARMSYRLADAMLKERAK